MKNSILIVLCGLLSAAVATPATNNNARDEKAVMATLEAMAQATIKKDIATLDKIYSPDLTYSHSSAFLQNKAEVLKAAAGKKASAARPAVEKRNGASPPLVFSAQKVRLG